MRYQYMISKRNYVESLSRGLSILSLIAESPTPLTLTQISEKLRVSKSSIQRLTRTLGRSGYLERDKENKKYRLGPTMLSIGFSAAQDLDLKKAAYPYLEEAAKKTGETLNLAVLDKKEIVYIERIVSQRALSVNIQIGSRRPLYCTSMGKVILAFMPEDQREEFLKTIKLIPFSPRTITRKRVLRIELERIRLRGFATGNEELEIGVRSVAAPIRNSEGKIIAAVNIAVPASRVSMKTIECELARDVLETGNKISSVLGYMKGD
jgi:PcaR/PcaU/PobR family beta-ketoadipate pathway transcriptional regulator